MSETKTTETKLNSTYSRSAKAGERMAVSQWFSDLNSEITQCRVEYVWVDVNGEFRSKTKTMDYSPHSVKDIPIWNFDGSSTGQAPGDNSEIILHPVKMVWDPFRAEQNVLALCECKHPDESAALGNNRCATNKTIFEQELVKAQKPWYGLEQEYTLFQSDGVSPLGWPPGGQPERQGPYYCGVGAEKVFGRDIADAHYSACLYAGLTISGINGEVMPGQWEFQVGPCEGVDAGDQLLLARYILGRVCEMFGVIVTFHPKPIKGDWNGAGLHTNFSTLDMRNDGGYKHILDAMPKLEAKHEEHIAVYGLGNEERLTGLHETSSIHDFSYGVANRGASIRIPRQVYIDKKGYLEDRRPASSADPYLVTAKMAETIIDPHNEFGPDLECGAVNI